MASSTRAWRARRRFALLLIGVGVLGSGLAYREFWLARPVGEGPAGPPVPIEPFERTWHDGKVLMVGLGDSVTAGLGARGASHSYFNRLVDNPDDEHADVQGRCLSRVIPQLDTLNLAISGSTSLTHLEVITKRLPQQPEDTLGIVVMTSGGNDLIHSYGRQPPKEGAMYGATMEQAMPWIDNFRERLNTMLERIGERFPGGCHVFLGDIYDPTDGVGDAPSVFLPDWPDGLRIHRAYNEVIHECIDRRDNVHLVELYDAFLGHGSHCRQFWRATYRADDPHYWYYANIEDPNDRGYDAIRRVYLLEMIDVLAPSRGVTPR